MSRIFPIHPTRGPVSRTRQQVGHFVQNHWALLSQAGMKSWRELAAKNSRRRRPGREERGFKILSIGENGFEEQFQ